MHYFKLLMAGVCFSALGACSGGSLIGGLDTGAGSTLAGLSGADGLTDTAASRTASATNAATNTGSTNTSGIAGTTGTSGTDGTFGITGDNGRSGTAGASLLGSGGILSSGLGLTGSNGTVSYVVGSDPVGGTVNRVLGNGNELTQMLGTSSTASSRPLVPQVLSTLSGQSSAALVPNGLGVTGAQGLTTDVLGTDIGGAVLGTTAPVPAALAGGSSSLLKPVLDATGLSNNIARVVPAANITNALNNIPALGVSGVGGLDQDLLGQDVVGNLLGTQTGLPHALAGGNNGALGQVLNGLQPLTQPSQGTAWNGVNMTNGTSSSPVASVLQATTPGGAVSTVVSTAVTGATSALPAVGTAMGTSAGSIATPAANTANGGLATILNSATQPIAGVTSALGNTLGAVTKGLTSSLPTQGSVSGAP